MNPQLTIRQYLDLLNQGITEIDDKIKGIFVFATGVSQFPVTGDENHLYIDTTNNMIYYWNTANNSYQSLSGSGQDIPLADATKNGLFSSAGFVKLQGITPEANKVTSSDTNGAIFIDGVEDIVFDYTKIPLADADSNGFMSGTQVTKLAGIAEGATKTQVSTTKGNIVINDVEVPIFNLSDVPNVTTTTNGLMLATDKAKLDTVAENATATAKSEQNGYIKINGTDVLVYAGGGSVPPASPTQDGTMSKEDFVKLSGISAGATKTEASTVNGNIQIDDTEVTVLDISKLPLASATVNGQMSSSGFTKLEGISENATKTEKSTTNGNIKIDGVETQVVDLTALPLASATQNGQMSKENFTKLSGISVGANKTEKSDVNGNILVDGNEINVLNIADLPLANTTTAGQMSSADFNKLAGIASGATAVATSDTNGNILINGTESNVFDYTKIPNASTTVSGLMTAANVTKLNGIASEATKVTASTTNGNIQVNGTELNVYTLPADGTGVVAETADKLITPRSFSISGDVTATGVDFDGSANVALTATLNTITGIGTGVKPTVNNKGLVTKLNPLTVTDIPDLTSDKITDLGTAATKDVGTTAGNVVELGSDGLINIALLPPIAITKVYEADSEAAMLALPASAGSVCVRTDTPETFILREDPATVLANWVNLPHPSDAVTSVNGQIGAVNLTTSNITEGTNLYFTSARATANFTTNIGNTNSTSLKDGSTLVHTTNLATASANGLMTSGDFTKLAGISAGATKVTDSTTVGNIVIDGTETSVFKVTDIPDSSTTVKGLMLPAQVTKLNGIATSATNTQASTTRGNILVNGEEVDVFKVTDIPDASTTVKGLMTTAQTTKLNGITANATKTEASTTRGNIVVNGSQIDVFKATDIPEATTTTAGRMTTTQVTKLNGIATGATNTTGSSTVGNIIVNGTQTKVFNVSDIPAASASVNGLLASADYTQLKTLEQLLTPRAGTPVLLHVNGRQKDATNATGTIFEPFANVADAFAYITAQSLPNAMIMIDDGYGVNASDFVKGNCRAVISMGVPINLDIAAYEFGNMELICNTLSITTANCTISSPIKAHNVNKVVAGSLTISGGTNGSPSILFEQYTNAQNGTLTISSTNTNAPFVEIKKVVNMDIASQITTSIAPMAGSRIGYIFYGLVAQN